MRLAASLLLAAALAACNSNTSAGADREAQGEPATAAAPRMGAGAALDGIATEAIALETMTDADLAALGAEAGNCRFLTTEVAKPSLAFEEGVRATIKLNGKLITLPAAGAAHYGEGGIDVQLRPLEGEGNAGLPEHEMILMLPGAADELGYRGYLRCT